MGKSFVENLASKLIDKVVDVDSFEIREPYKRMAFGVAKTGVHKFKNSKAMEIIDKEPNIAVFRKIFAGKAKVLRPDQLADESLQHNLYHVLGVKKDADADSIKKAFRAAATKYHPDKNAGNQQAHAIFKKVNQAYDVLSDTKKRALYDEFGEMSFRMNFDPEVARSGGYG